jgi:uncharacterized protein YndB with AHSA1/START domain
MNAVEREVTVPAPPADVWPVVIDPDQVSAWFGADAELDPRPGGRAVFRWPDGTERAAVIEDVDPGRRLAFRWLPFQRTADGETITVPPSRVAITLDPVPEGTRVRVVEEVAVARFTTVRSQTAGPLLASVEA